jgi:cysteine synthase
MDVRSSTLDAIGNTALIKLRKASEETGCTILGKAEFMNPGLSVKDRAALGIVTDAIEKGQLRPGGLIVEGTAGNTGIGLTVVGNALGMNTVIVIPETQSQEKKDTLRSLGATLVEVPAVPYRNPNNYVKVAGRMAERLARDHPHGAIFANQFDNIANRDIHVRTTGPEIWEQTGGTVDGFVSAVGTGGTLAGVAAALRERNRGVVIAIADVPGAALYSYYTTGELKAEGSSITEGIGQGRITANLEGLKVDEAFFIPDAESLDVAYGLLRDEGLSLGLSSGVNVAGAIRLARKLGPGKTIVTILCDPGSRYQSRLYNAGFLHSKGLSPPEWLEQPQSIAPDFEEVS